MNSCFLIALAAAVLLGNNRGGTSCSGRSNHCEPCKEIREEVRGCAERCVEPEIIRHHCGDRRNGNRC